MNIGAQGEPCPIRIGSIEGEVGSIETQMEELGSLIASLEADLYQVLTSSPSEGGVCGSGKPSPSTPLASRLTDVSVGLRNLSDRLRSIRGRVDI